MAVKNIFSSLQQTCNRPWACIRSWATPERSPSDTLRRIAASADRTIQDAALHGIKIPSRAGAIDAELSPILHPEPLQERVNWQQRQSDLLKTLTDKISVFTALLQMRNRAGIVEPNNLKILGLVQQATESRVPVSLWDLFTSQYELSWFQKLSAAFFYWFYYQTSLIHNTVDAYLEAFFLHLTTDLTKQSNETRTKVFRGFIEEINEFLTEDIKAARAYAHGEMPGSLAKLQDQAIERVYGGLLSKLCEDFSQSQVLGASPQVRILKDFQDLFVIGRCVRALEWAINRYVIQSAMMYSILPQALQTGVNQGIAVTHVDNLPFVISLTQFFTSQLESLRLRLESDEPGDESIANGPMPGTELLPPTIKLLLQALALEGPFTPLELKKQLELLEEEGNSLLDATILENMEKAIIESGNTLFSYLNQSIRSGELLTRLLELSLNPFSGQVRTEETLRAEYREEQSKFFRTSDIVFRQLIRKAISPTHHVDAKQKSQMAYKTLERQKTVASLLIQKMGALCDQIGQKIEASQGQLSPEYDIQKDFVALSQILQVLESRHEFQDSLDSVDGTNRNEIWNIFNSLFNKVALLQEQMTQLRTQSQDHLQQAAIIEHLQTIQATIDTLQESGSMSFAEMFQITTADLVHLLGAQHQSVMFLQTKEHLISEQARQVAQETQILESLQALSSQPNPESAPTGLLVQLFQAEQGISLFGSKRKTILNKISQHLALFSIEERSALTNLIGDGTQISTRWDRILSTLQNIYRAHMEKQRSSRELLDNNLLSLRLWVQDQIEQRSTRNAQTYQTMRSHMTTLADLKTDLLKAAQNIPSSVTTPLSPIIWNSASLSLPVSAALYLGGVATLPVALGAGISGLSLRLLNPGTPSGDSFKRSFFKKCATVGASALGACLLPASAISTAAWCIPAALAGKEIVDIGREYAEHHIFEQVWDKFTQAYRFTCSQRVYKALLTRFLKRTVQTV